MFRSAVIKELDHQIFTFLRIFFFSGQANLKQIAKQRYGARGVRGHASRMIFENVHAVMPILVLFEQFLRQILLNYFHP